MLQVGNLMILSGKTVLYLKFMEIACAIVKNS